MVTTSQLKICDLLECRSDFDAEFITPNLSTAQEVFKVYNVIFNLIFIGNKLIST